MVVADLLMVVDFVVQQAIVDWVELVMVIGAVEYRKIQISISIKYTSIEKRMDALLVMDIDSLIR